MKTTKKYIKDVLKNNKETQEGLFQATLNIGYDAWQKNSNEFKYPSPSEFGFDDTRKGDWMYNDEGNYIEGYEKALNHYRKNTWSYHDMLEWVEENYGKLARLVIQIGKYNQQVGNGGHSQYYGCNNYGTSGKHTWMTNRFNEMFDEKMLPTPIGKFKTILNTFNKRIGNNSRDWSGAASDLDNRLWLLEECLIQWVEDQIKIEIFNNKF